MNLKSMHCQVVLSRSPQTNAKRQVRAIRPGSKKISEASLKCSFGQCNKASFPAHIKSTSSYGKRIDSLLGNLSARQYITYGRSTEFLSDLFDLSISEGTIVNILTRFTGKAQGV